MKEVDTLRVAGHRGVMKRSAANFVRLSIFNKKLSTMNEDVSVAVSIQAYKVRDVC